MDRKRIIEALFDSKIIRILKLFINNPGKEYYLREISRITRVSITSTFRIIKTLKANELILEKKTKHLKTYMLNEENSGFLAELLEDKRSALLEFTEFIGTQSGIDMAVLNGEEEPDKATIILVGQGIDQQSVVTKIVEIREKYNYNIIHLILAQEQYDTMLSMGLYKGTQTVVYRK